MFRQIAISRRKLLRGVGAAVSLPLLDCMVPAMTATTRTAASSERLRRIGYVYIPMGFNPDRWTPQEDTLETLPFSLQPLSPIKDQVTVLSNMDLKNAYPGSHATSNSAFLSAARAKLTESSDYYLGTTVDQIAAKQIVLYRPQHIAVVNPVQREGNGLCVDCCHREASTSRFR